MINNQNNIGINQGFILTDLIDGNLYRLYNPTTKEVIYQTLSERLNYESSKNDNRSNSK